MPDNPDVYRSVHSNRPDDVTLRESQEVEADEGMMELRLPIASTGDVRNEGDDPLTSRELRGMAKQVDSLTRGVFPEHGMSDAIDRDQYSQFEKLGYWAAADIQAEASADGEDLLMATARMPDPETLPAATGDYREALAILKEQAKRGVPVGSSIGWRDDEDAPGGVDLMEASIVGIGADPRTVSEGGEQLVARAAIEAGADPEDLVAAVRAATRDYAEEGSDPDEGRPLGPPGDRDRFESFDECVATLSEDDDVSREDAEQICGAWEQASASDAPEDTHDMTEDDTPPDENEGGTTDDTEQHADDGDTETRAPEDVSEDDLLTFTAMHFDGMDEGDMAEAVDAADAEYIGECDPEALADLVSEATGAEYGDVVDAMDDLMTESDGDTDEEQGDYGDDDMDDEDDEGEEQAAADPDETQAADDEADDLEQRLADLEDDIQAIRSGDIEIEDPSPDTDEEQSADDDESEQETRDADEQDSDDGSTLRDEWLTN